MLSIIIIIIIIILFFPVDHASWYFQSFNYFIIQLMHERVAVKLIKINHTHEF